MSQNCCEKLEKAKKRINEIINEFDKYAEVQSFLVQERLYEVLDLL